MQGALDLGGTRSHFNVVPAMPLMEVFLAKDSDVHRSEGGGSVRITDVPKKIGKTP